MKKILLLLLISLSFISSANTNSIEGAFGYKLGQVVEGIKLEVDRNDFKDRYENFMPAKPMPPFDTFIVYATLKNKVYAITGYVSGIKMDNYNSCNSNKKFRKLLNALEKKYGEGVAEELLIKSKQTVKYSNDDLQELILYYNNLLKQYL